MNSAISYLVAEVHGRLTWSVGVMYLYGPEIETLLLPDARKITPTARKKILAAFAPILKRDIKKISEEVKQKDRRAFDNVVLEALGLDPKKYLDDIYGGLIGMVESRIALGKMQKIEQQKRVTKSTKKIKEEVMRETLSDGLRPFPESFLPHQKKPKLEMSDIAIPSGKLTFGEYFLGKQKLINADGDEYEAQSSAEARYILYARKPDSHIIQMPISEVAIELTVQKYRMYIDEVRKGLMRAFVARTGDASLSERLSAEVLEDLGVFL